MAVDGFDALLTESRAFFRALQNNNSKEWFEPRKEEFAANIRKPAEFLASLMAEDLSRLTGAALSPRVFRIHRDLRFSKDKTPYKTWLHMTWQTHPIGPLTPMLFFGVEPEATRVGCGIMGLSGPALTRYRACVDRHGEALEEAIETAGGVLSEHMADLLQKVPRPYTPDHPQGDLLRRKSLIAMRELGPDWMPGARGLIPALLAEFKTLIPLRALLAEHL